MSQLMKMWIQGGGRAFRKQKEFKEKFGDVQLIRRWNIVRGMNMLLIIQPNL
jgi:hypothetical protein